MDHDQEQGLPPDSPLMTMSHSFLHDEMLKLSIPGPSRDPTYYIGDGNTVLLVDNTLFKVCWCVASGGRAWCPLVSMRRKGLTSALLGPVGPPVNSDERQVCVRDNVPAVRGDRLGTLGQQRDSDGRRERRQPHTIAGRYCR